MCERDAANGVEIAQQLVGKVSRKVVKQTVMTLVYGVTFIGGRRQISGQLDDLGLSPSVVWQGSSYLTRNVFASIREMFHAAKDIQVGAMCMYRTLLKLQGIDGHTSSSDGSAPLIEIVDPP